jgi:hypothetical protein
MVKTRELMIPLPVAAILQPHSHKPSSLKSFPTEHPPFLGITQHFQEVLNLSPNFPSIFLAFSKTSNESLGC